MKRKLFCQISPLTYAISTKKCQFIRHAQNLFGGVKLANTLANEPLPVLVYRHKSLIRRQLGDVDMQLQENKAMNLALATPRVNGLLIAPGETFSFWHMVGNTTKRKGYKEGLTISNGGTARDIGGGMCQFTNLLHWLVLHTPLPITEHHHHDGLDLFPDFNRQIPFGTGTSILYNYRDYRFSNPTNRVYQLITTTTDKYLCGEIRCNLPQPEKYHITSENEHFVDGNGTVYRCGQVYRKQIDPVTGNCTAKTLLRNNHAKVLYPTGSLVVTRPETVLQPSISIALNK